MSAQVEAIINYAIAQHGKPYWADDYRRLGPDRFDCSGLQWRAATYGGRLHNVPTLSWTMARWCTQVGTMIRPWQDALHLRGVWLFMGANEGRDGFGSDGHVATSLGDTNVVETPAWGAGVHAVGVDTALDRDWSGAAYIPGVDYRANAPVPSPLPREEDMTSEEHGWLAATTIYSKATYDRVAQIQGWVSALYAMHTDLNRPGALATLWGNIAPMRPQLDRLYNATFNFQNPSGLLSIFDETHDVNKRVQAIQDWVAKH